MDDTFPFPGQLGPSARRVPLSIPKDQAALLNRSEAWVTSPKASNDRPRTANLPAGVLEFLKDHYCRAHRGKSSLEQAAGSPKPQGSEGENMPTHAASTTEAGATEEEGASVAASKEGVTEFFQEATQEGVIESSREATQEGANIDDDSHSLDHDHIESSPEQFPSSWAPSPDQGQRKPVEVASSPNPPGTPSKPQQQTAPPSSLDSEEELELVVACGVRDTARAASRRTTRSISSSSPRYISTHPPPCGQGDRVVVDVDSTPDEPEEVVAKPEAMEKPVPGRRRRRMQQPHFSSDSAIPGQAVYPGNRFATARIPSAKVNASDLDSSQASGLSPTPEGVFPGPGKRKNTQASEPVREGEPLAKKPRTSHEVIHETAYETSHGTTHKTPHGTLHGENHKEIRKTSQVETRGTPCRAPYQAPLNTSYSASYETAHDTSHEVTHGMPPDASGVEPYDISHDTPREPCSEGPNRREILVPATPSTSHPNLAITGRRILHTIEHPKPYDSYTAKYPEYRGSIWDFVRACVCLNYMQERDMLREFLYDDFIRAFQEEYPYYVVECGGNLPAQQWFNRLRGPVIFHEMVITCENLHLVFEAYPEVHQGVENGHESPGAHKATRQSPTDGTSAANHRRGSAQESIQAITPTPKERPVHPPYTAQQASRTTSAAPVRSGKTPSTAPASQRVTGRGPETVRDRGSPVGISSQAPLVIPATQPLEPSMPNTQRSGLVPVPGSQAQRTRGRDPLAINPPTPYSTIAESPFKLRTPLDRPDFSPLAHGHPPGGTDSRTPQDRSRHSPSTHGHPSSEKSSRAGSRTGPVSTGKGTCLPDPRVSTPKTAPVANMQARSPGHFGPPQTPTTAPVVKPEQSSPKIADFDDRRGLQLAGEEAPGRHASNESPARDASNPVNSSPSSGSWAPAGAVASPATKGVKPRRARSSVASRPSAEKETPDRRASNGSSARDATSLASRRSTESLPHGKAVESPAAKDVEPRRAHLSNSTGTRSPDLGVSAGPSSALPKTNRRIETPKQADSSLSPVKNQPAKERATSKKTKEEDTRRARHSVESADPKKSKVAGGRVQKKEKKSGGGKSGRKPRLSREEALRQFMLKKRAESVSGCPASKT